MNGELDAPAFLPLERKPLVTVRCETSGSRICLWSSEKYFSLSEIEPQSLGYESPNEVAIPTELSMEILIQLQSDDK